MEPNAFPLFVAVSVTATAVLVVGLVILAIRAAANRAAARDAAIDRPQEKAWSAAIGRWLFAAVAVWVGSALFVTSGVWTPPSLAIPVYILGLAGAGFLLLTRTTAGRKVLDELPQSWLIGAQVYRVVGGVFLIAASYAAVPTYFAIPAGWGDLFVGAGAVVIAMLFAAGATAARPAAWAWNLTGLLDLIVAVGIGSSLLAAPAAAIWGGSPFWLVRAAAGWQPFGPSIFHISFPLALIPTLIVPLSVLLHVLSLRKLAASGGFEEHTTDRPYEPSLRPRTPMTTTP